MSSSTCGNRPSPTTSAVKKYRLLTPTCIGMWKLIACKASPTILTAFSTHSFFEACALTLLDPSQVAMSLTSALCKPIATASSASNCCKCLANLIMTLRFSPPQKRNKNGKHLRLRPRTGPTRRESSPSKRLPLLLSLRPSLSISNVKDLDVSVEELPSLTHMPSAFTKRIMRRVPLLRPIYWPRKRRPLLIPNRTRQVLPTWQPRVRHAKHSNPHRTSYPGMKTTSSSPKI
jgi:hypothetical protein